MRYEKPQLASMGSAIAAIQTGLAKGDEMVDNGQQSVPAYASDES